jgi:hypothetical protein
MSKKIIKADDLNINKINFSDNIRTNKYSGKSVYVNYDNGPFRIQMPKMSLPFGVSLYKNPETGDEKHSLELSWADVKPELLEKFKKLESNVIDYVEKNSKEFFKKQKSRVVLEELYQSYLKIAQDDKGNPIDKYAPRLKVKMYVDGSNFNIDAYDAEKVNGKYPRIHLTKDNIDDYMSKGAKVETILQCSGIWVVDQKFGISWVLVQVKIHKNENKLIGYAFEDDSDAEEHAEDSFEKLEEQVHELELEEEHHENEEEDEPVKKRKQRGKRDYL